MKKIIIISLVALFFLSCKKEYKVELPDTSNWQLFNDPAAQSLNYVTPHSNGRCL
jgi:hypothetical protein